MSRVACDTDNFTVTVDTVRQCVDSGQCTVYGSVWTVDSVQCRAVCETTVCQRRCSQCVRQCLASARVGAGAVGPALGPFTGLIATIYRPLSGPYYCEFVNDNR